MASAPIAASSQSRSKLQVFRCEESIQKASFSQNDAFGERCTVGKENEVVVSNRKVKGDSFSTNQNQFKALSQCSGKRDRKDCPQTPNGRLPLAELIANGEDAARLLVLTPVERVAWNYDPQDVAPFSSSATAPSQNGKRRRNSSSPVSSSQNEAPNHLTAAQPTVDLQHPQQSQKTPHADPAGDLWHRYSLNPKDRPTELETTFEQLIHSSSPDVRSIQMGGIDASGLRRSMSCGMEWPTSAAKRRKIQRSKTTSRGDEYVAAVAVAVDNPSKSTSRVKFLVERIQDVLAGPTEDETKPSPSSSLRLPNNIGRECEASPLHRFEGKLRLDIAAASQKNLLQGDEAINESYMELSSNTDISQERQNDTSNSSDFGEDDIDLEALEAIDGGAVDGWQKPAVSGLRQDVLLQIVRHANLEQSDENPTINENVKLEPPEREHSGEQRLSAEAYRAERAENLRKSDVDKVMESDDFDEDDSEILAADLEDVAALYDCRKNLGPQADSEESFQNLESRGQQFTPLMTRDHLDDNGNGHNGTTKNVIEVSSDEEFGDDDDFEQLADECVKASQAHAGPTPVRSSVRSVYFGPSI